MSAETRRRAVVRAGLAGEMRRGVVRAGLAALLVLAAVGSSALVAVAADPTASPGAGGDVRTNPTAPGLVGEPLFALVGVTIIGLLSVVVTLIAVRLTERR